MADAADVTILVVDDDEAKRYTIAEILRRAGFGSARRRTAPRPCDGAPSSPT